MTGFPPARPGPVSAEHLNPAWHALPSTGHRTAWVVSGLFVQLLGVAAAGGYVAARAEKTQAVVTRATLLLVGHEVVHTPRGAAVLAGSAVLFALGSMALARPYVRSWFTLLVAVPVAAVAGLLVLGVLALVVAVIAFVLCNDLDLPDFSRDRRRKRRRPTR